jgi:hypothetical protein
MPENKLKCNKYWWPVMRLTGTSSVILPGLAQLEGMKSI